MGTRTVSEYLPIFRDSRLAISLLVRHVSHLKFVSLLSSSIGLVSLSDVYLM